ncbi:uncharacterized protein CBL_03907 [Carabus blaptoides fortunei]
MEGTSINSEESSSSEAFSTTRELESYSTINTKNLEHYEQCVDSIADQLQVKCEPWTYFENLASDVALLNEQKYKLFVKNKACVAEQNLYLQKISEESEEIEDCKEQINDVVKLLKELSIAKDESHKKAKDKHNAFKLAMQYYKDILNLYIHVEKNDENSLTIKLCFFTNKLDDSYSVTLLQSGKDEWNLVNIKPEIMDCQFVALKQKLEETKNMPAFVKIRDFKGLSKDCTHNLQQKYSDVHPGTIASIVAQECQKRAKLSNYKDRVDLENVYSTFKKLKRENNSTGFLVKLANQLGLAPTIIARRVLSQYYAEKLKQEEEDNAFFAECSRSPTNESESDSSADETKPSVLSDEQETLSDGESESSKETQKLECSNETGQSDTSHEVVSDSAVETQHSKFKPFKGIIRLALQDATIIDDMHLAHEVFLCTLYDDQYTQLAETIKHTMGQQYEVRLQRHLRQLGIPYKDEHGLRKSGYDKTPDVKLDVPVAVNGFLINWIESKALFGSEEVHEAYVAEQYVCYWNRFGPGLVIYWFGFVNTLESNNRMLIMDNIPDVMEIISLPSNGLNIS